jgi:hypothetical protein
MLEGWQGDQRWVAVTRAGVEPSEEKLVRKTVVWRHHMEEEGIGVAEEEGVRMIPLTR